MTGLSNRSVGWALAAAGVVLSVFHLVNIARRGVTPLQLFIEGIPLVLSITLAIVGALLARDRLIAPGFAGRMLAWIAAGVASLCALGAWHFSIIIILGSSLPLLAAMLDVATFGALVGALVGIYDVRGRERQQSIERLHRINDTIRIATQELVNRTDRDALERAVCDRLAESDPYEGVWLGRYDADAARVRPSAWAGLEDEYVESLDVTVDDSPTGTGAGGRAIKTGEIQCVPDVFADPSMEPWWDEFERRGVTSIAVVPIAHDETVYGFVSIYADRRTVFDDYEQAVLAELGESIGHAVASLEARDRLARREAELARQNDRLDAFAGIVSHDLRNPLNVALGNVELAREQRDGDDGPLEDAAAALERMEALIRDLLVLSRQGETIDDLEAVPLGDVVDAAWSTTAGSSAATLRIDGDLGTIACDRDRLRQLLENLFRNSVDHAGPDVTVTVRRTDAGFEVFDDGPGIPSDLEDRVFEAGVTTDDDGTGFGLDIVRTIADAHDWSVSLRESPDGGACFEFAGVETPDSYTDGVGTDTQ
ncbi:ATP-binding protein [Natrinema thermotolerans]|uniref:histidine kinase n=1 Tax=Natrinema thermotolerans TaxID=121872 RepID=A0AAF0T3Y5_9EURY|nr:ATP-binding protein [Natrinema thermotolerans]QCC58735.1 GAF domain-containing protein [Natrinema thermotolerans]WMT09887.1 ATP-binding protein [Natrinema thermotolerans]